MENQNNNLINKAKEEIESAKNVISNMNDKNKTIPEKVNSEVEILDELSKACQLAMSNISFLATKSISKDIKAALVSIYSGYTDILSSINQNFAQIGEIPSNVSPNLKMVGLCSINLNTKVDKSVSHIAEIMIQGLNMGIIKCQKLLNSSNSSSIRKETLDLIQRFLDFQESSIQKLKMYL